MDIKYSKKKEDLRNDPLIDGLKMGKQYLREHGNRMMTGVVVIALCVAGYFVYSYMKKANMVKAQEDFGKAMILYNDRDITKSIEAFNQVVENHGSSPHAAYSAYMIGQIYLAGDNFDDAIKYFEKSLSSKKSMEFIPGQSLEALGICYEAKGDNEKALDYFEKALKDGAIPHRYPAIRWKMALLNKKLGNNEKVLYYCKELAFDTLAVDYKKKAENLVAVLKTN